MALKSREVNKLSETCLNIGSKFTHNYNVAIIIVIKRFPHVDMCSSTGE